MLTLPFFKKKKKKLALFTLHDKKRGVAVKLYCKKIISWAENGSFESIKSTYLFGLLEKMHLREN